jgi:hypothetical protein
MVRVESLQAHPARDSNTNRFLKVFEIAERVPKAIARRAARMRRQSASNPIVVALAEPSGAMLTSDPDDLEALAAYSDGVLVQRV